ncbi:uncharacterized protein YpiB (UPF0302 family) [Salsuginibacillus halophilus]|uniref:Uncharacterized protein YpiB (UPF0302 family) n=1 Tax=Salsuginibacillus halophilus TaxID=517424 RepID=A0A2P8HWF1_9BACI|nr:YpiB family protein [Salsuginibacillus halophilus]PSL50508.1 uncharacterized protein YpiB (UPF0302 family) [Salsuginibacillus halophilus]
MASVIEREEKRKFIEWLLAYNILQDRRITWLLQYMAAHNTLLEEVRFVPDAREAPRLLRLNDAECHVYFQEGLTVAHDAEACYHRLQARPEFPLYIELQAADLFELEAYQTILEGNPYHPERRYLQQGAEAVAAWSLYEKEVKRLKTAIDEALDAGDQSRFERLSSEWQALNKNFNKEWKS